MGITSNRGIRNFALFVAAVNIITGVLVIIGWIYKIREFTHIHAGYLSMKFNTAICVVCMGTALFLIICKGLSMFKNVGYVLAAVSFLIAVISFSEYLFDYDAYIDKLFYSELEVVAIPHPEGRITPVTSLAICIISAGILFSEKRRHIACIQYLLHIVTVMMFTGIMGYVFNIQQLHSHSFATSIALQSAVTLFLLSVGVATLNPDLGFVRLFSGKFIGNLMAKKLFTKIVLALLVVVYLFIITYRRNIMSVELAVVFYAMILLFAILLFINDTSNTLNKIESDRKFAEERFQLVVESVPSALIISDSKGNILLANRHAKLVFGYSEGEMVGKN